MRQLELAGLLRVSARERTPLVAEELALEQLAGERGAVDLHQRTFGSVALGVDAPRDHVLSHTTLTDQQHGHVRVCDALYEAPYATHRRRDRARSGAALWLDGRGPARRKRRGTLERPADHEVELREREQLRRMIRNTEVHRIPPPRSTPGSPGEGNTGAALGTCTVEEKLHCALLFGTYPAVRAARQGGGAPLRTACAGETSNARIRRGCGARGPCAAQGRAVHP